MTPAARPSSTAGSGSKLPSAAKAEHGESASAVNLPRTEAQHCADAFVAAMTQAASVAPGATAPEPSAYVLFSSDAFELAVNELAGDVSCCPLPKQPSHRR